MVIFIQMIVNNEDCKKKKLNDDLANLQISHPQFHVSCTKKNPTCCQPPQVVFKDYSPTDNSTFHGKFFSFLLQCNPTWMRGNFGIKLQNSPKLPRRHVRFYGTASLQNRRDFLRTGESEASAKRELRAWGGSLKNPACQHTIVQALPPPDTP